MLQPFDLSVSREPGVITVSVSGELDIATGPQLTTALQLALGDESIAEQVILDLSQLSFCGSVGLGVLVRANRLATVNGISFAIVVEPQGQVGTAVEISGLGEHLPVVATVDEVKPVRGRRAGRS